MRKLVIIEGVDGTGKTTQAKILCEKLQARLIQQPSKDNIVSFIRDEMKLNPNYTALERQLLGAVSHTVDAFTCFADDQNVVMDRSYLSGMVYGKISGVEGYELAMLTNLLGAVYKHNVADRFDVKIIFLNCQARLDNPDDDMFEKNLSWRELSTEYTSLCDKLRSGQKAFSNHEAVTQIDVSGKSIEQVAAEIETFVNAESV